MKKIKEALANIAEWLGLTEAKLNHARGRRQFNSNKAQTKSRKARRAEDAADEIRAEASEIDYNDTADPVVSARLSRLARKARRKDRKAQRLHREAHKYQDRAQWWIARCKELERKVNKLEKSQRQKEAELAKWRKEHGVQVKGDKVTGGTARQRLVAGALAAVAGCSSGKRRNVYSQPGAWDIKHGITGEAPGYRSDCSQWVTAIYHAAGLPDPNGEDYTGGYTGTLVANGKQISRDKLEPGDLVIYGDGTGFHVEMFIGPGSRTAGHGSAPIDFGVVDLVPGATTRYFTYL